MDVTDHLYLVTNHGIQRTQGDVLYHFGLDTKELDFPKEFGGVKFVLCGGTDSRMKSLANYLSTSLGIGKEPINLSKSERFVLYRVGPAICVSHGMGMASLSIMLHEMFKLLFHSCCTDVTFIRLGTSGGIGIPPGTVVISDRSLNGLLESFYEKDILGKRVKIPSVIDATLAQELFEIGKDLGLPVVKGATMSTNDFYEGQARLDGAICSYTEADKFRFLQELHQLGVKNIEMEATAFGALTAQVHVKCGLVCYTLINRLDGDQVTTPPEVYHQWEKRPFQLVAALIKKHTS